MRIVQISTADQGGGAEGSAWSLFRAYEQLGHGSWLAVGRKAREHANVVEIPSAVSAARGLRTAAARRASRALGREDFHYPGSTAFERWLPDAPDIVHCHNLHGGYFDLRALPRLSARYPVLLDLRDEWLLSGHCAYSLDCARWAEGCGDCPHLDTYPAIARDATRSNWQRKRRILERSRIALSAPS